MEASKNINRNIQINSQVKQVKESNKRIKTNYSKKLKNIKIG